MTPRELQQSLVLAHFRQTNAISGRVPAELRGVDTRALRADAYRASRLAQSVLEAVPCFAVWFLAQPNAWARAVEFPHSAEFEAVVRGRRDLLEAAAAFFLAGDDHDIQARDLLALDLALAAAERDSVTVRPVPEHWQYASLVRGIRMISVQARVVAWHAQIRQELSEASGESLWERIWDCASRAPKGPDPRGDSGGESVRAATDAEPAEVERLLIVGRRGSGATAEKLEGGLAGLLDFVGPRRERSELVGFLADDMADEEAIELVESLAEEGLLVCRPEVSP